MTPPGFGYIGINSLTELPSKVTLSLAGVGPQQALSGSQPQSYYCEDRAPWKSSKAPRGRGDGDHCPVYFPARFPALVREDEPSQAVEHGGEVESVEKRANEAVWNIQGCRKF
jgi:hypothetical protein